MGACGVAPSGGAATSPAGLLRGNGVFFFAAESPSSSRWSSCDFFAPAPAVFAAARFEVFFFAAVFFFAGFFLVALAFFPLSSCAASAADASRLGVSSLAALPRALRGGNSKPWRPVSFRTSVAENGRPKRDVKSSSSSVGPVLQVDLGLVAGDFPLADRARHDEAAAGRLLRRGIAAARARISLGVFPSFFHSCFLPLERSERHRILGGLALADEVGRRLDDRRSPGRSDRAERVRVDLVLRRLADALALVPADGVHLELPLVVVDLDRPLVGASVARREAVEHAGLVVREQGLHGVAVEIAARGVLPERIGQSSSRSTPGTSGSQR